MSTSKATATAVTNTVFGKVLNKESRVPIADVLIDLFDLVDWDDPENPSPDAGGRDAVEIARNPQVLLDGGIANLYKTGKRVGSGITDASGQFVIEMTPKDLNLPRKSEERPDLILLVLAPDEPGMDVNKRLLHFSLDVRFNACSTEAHVILLKTQLLEERGIPFGPQKTESKESTTDKIEAYKKERDNERDLNSGAAAYHAEEFARETVERKAFKASFLKRLSTDFTKVKVRGAVATDGDNIRDKNLEQIVDGVAKANAVLSNQAAKGIPLNLYLTPADKAKLQTHFNAASAGFAEIPGPDVRDIIFSGNGSENAGTLLIHDNPITNFCGAESDDERCAKLHTGIEAHGTDTHDASHPTLPPSTDHPVSDGDILGYVDRLMRHVPAPDMVLHPELEETREDKDVGAAVNKFTLPKGPAEIPAFYDFHSVQIAFDHVWRQLFDESIPNLAYTANQIATTRFGIRDVFDTSLLHGAFAGVFTTITPVDVPTIVLRFFDITKEEFNELSYTVRQELTRLAYQIEHLTSQATLSAKTGNYTYRGSSITELRIIQSLTEQGERLIDGVRHDEYYTLHKTLRDLHARLSGKYEFTVFAADKDYHSVNFGLMNTYRQCWEPVCYQAGKLLKTIPLSPKEERKYSTRVTKQEKRTSKEARRNNSSLTTEQASTSRVEAEIMAKAQTKTNFGINAEGDYDIGIYEGKATTTFGVEALTESSQNRKDFREAVLKAAQEYKNETSVEVSSEWDFMSESTESGTIINPNDELAVTYLFYELQKRYKLSEKIYRVMPVVMVAQEVPSPDQITPAWVVANDWILNRVLLDDSFRPAIGYLINNSVGDDFSLRELRKNLRQQRNLVETLRIEFSSASMQADNRYRALEALIANRIDEQVAEDDDGLLNDVAQFVGAPSVYNFFSGGGNPNPEAAKARELAAKDSHQYALEKAEKASAALKQEVNVLHELTDRYNKTLQARLDNETMVKRLLVHIRNNIFYYMQAIWNMEPPDQRYLRLYKVQVPVLELESSSYSVSVATEDDIFSEFRIPGTEKHRAFLHGKLRHGDDGLFETKSLVEVADLSNVLSCIGNYLVFPMKAHNALTEFMAVPYVDSAFGAMDPDELSNVSLEEYSRYVCCLHDTLTKARFNALKPKLIEWLKKLLATGLRNGDEIVVPTGSLFIESLVDPNAILEEFKLKHRELDVYKVQAEVRRAELDNVRLAARLLNNEREDPDVEKKIVIEGNASVVVPES